MDKQISAVLLMPDEGDPHHLLGDPKSVEWQCGGRPPTVWWHRGTWGRVRLRGKPERIALVLKWKGKPLDAGMARAGRAEAIAVGAVGHGTHRDPEILARLCVRRGIATAVFLDDEGQEVAHG